MADVPRLSTQTKPRPQAGVSSYRHLIVRHVADAKRAMIPKGLDAADPA
jgi:hypothetical protein